MRPHIVESDDGSTLIEWVFDHHRFGISLDLNISESSWYFVSDREGGDVMQGDLITDEFFRTINNYLRKTDEKHDASDPTPSSGAAEAETGA